MLEAERAKLGDDDAGVFAGDVAQEQVAARSFGHVADPNDVDRRWMIEQRAVRRVRELLRSDDAEVDHGSTNRYPMRASVRKYRGCAGSGSSFLRICAR